MDKNEWNCTECDLNELYPGRVGQPDGPPIQLLMPEEGIVLRQTRVESFVEAFYNILIGFGINFVANLLVLPHFGFTNLSLSKNFAIGLIFTVISVTRQYVIRRWAQDHLRSFNKKVSAWIVRTVRRSP